MGFTEIYNSVNQFNGLVTTKEILMCWGWECIEKCLNEYRKKQKTEAWRRLPKPCFFKSINTYFQSPKEEEE